MQGGGGITVAKKIIIIIIQSPAAAEPHLESHHGRRSHVGHGSSAHRWRQVVTAEPTAATR